MDIAIILVLELIISIATYGTPSTPKVEYVQPTLIQQTTAEPKAESVQPTRVEQSIVDKNTLNKNLEL
jgi:hypothetical protein